MKHAILAYIHMALLVLCLSPLPLTAQSDVQNSTQSDSLFTHINAYTGEKKWQSYCEQYNLKRSNIAPYNTICLGMSPKGYREVLRGRS